jgi:hypothetical protein
MSIFTSDSVFTRDSEIARDSEFSGPPSEDDDDPQRDLDEALAHEAAAWLRKKRRNDAFGLQNLENGVSGCLSQWWITFDFLSIDTNMFFECEQK